MDVWLAYYYDENEDCAWELIGVARTAQDAQLLADRWAHQNGIQPGYISWTLDANGWTRYQLFVRQFFMPDTISP